MIILIPMQRTPGEIRAALNMLEVACDAARRAGDQRLLDAALGTRDGIQWMRGQTETMLSELLKAGSSAVKQGGDVQPLEFIARVRRAVIASDAAPVSRGRYAGPGLVSK